MFELGEAWRMKGRVRGIWKVVWLMKICFIFVILQGPISVVETSYIPFNLVKEVTAAHHWNTWCCTNFLHFSSLISAVVSINRHWSHTNSAPHMKCTRLSSMMSHINVSEPMHSCQTPKANCENIHSLCAVKLK